MDRESGDVTKVLQGLRRGSPEAYDLLIPLVYRELRRIAGAHMRREFAPHALQPTALVHEAYLRLIEVTKVEWQDRAHFYSVASTIMRRILVDNARGRRSQKRGDTGQALSFDGETIPSPSSSPEICDLDDALNRLAVVNHRGAKVVEMRFFAGMTEEEIGEVLGVSARTVKREWQTARTWLFHELAK